MASSGPALRADSRPHRPLKPPQVVSFLTGDNLSLIRKKYHLPAVRLPLSSENICSPPAGFISVYEMTLESGVRFPLASELVEVLTVAGVSLSQLSRRAVVILVGMIAFFRDRGSKLTPEILSRLCRLVPDPHGRISCRSSSRLEMRVSDPARNWASRFFYVKNDWNLREKWGDLKSLPSSLHISEDDILAQLGLTKWEDFQFEMRFPSNFVAEEFLFKVGLSFQAGRSDAQSLKPSNKVGFQQAVAKRPQPARQEDEPLAKRKKAADIVPTSGRGSQVSSSSFECSSRPQIPEEVLKHSCLGLQRATDLSAQLDASLREWNREFVTLKYFHGEYKRRYKEKEKEVADLESQLSGCRAELASLSTSHSREVDRVREEAAEARSSANQARKSLKTSEAQVRDLERRITELTAQVSERETHTDSQAVERFRSSMAFRMIIQERIEEERERIHSTEARTWERQGREDGFHLGFLKAIRLVQRRTGADIEGLSPSQVSEDPPSDIEDEVVSIPGSPEDYVDVVD